MDKRRGSNLNVDNKFHFFIFAIALRSSQLD